MFTDSRKQLKSYKKFLEKQENKYNSIVTECVQIAKKMKNEKPVSIFKLFLTNY